MTVKCQPTKRLRYFNVSLKIVTSFCNLFRHHVGLLGIIWVVCHGNIKKYKTNIKEIKVKRKKKKRFKNKYSHYELLH